MDITHSSITYYRQGHWENYDVDSGRFLIKRMTGNLSYYDDIEHFIKHKGETHSRIHNQKFFNENFIESFIQHTCLSHSIVLITSSTKLNTINLELRLNAEEQKLMVHDREMLLSGMSREKTTMELNLGSPFQRNNCRGNGLVGGNVRSECPKGPKGLQEFRLLQGQDALMQARREERPG
ncbi:hypothetical protein Tco_1352185 [Tanacetum coccineum]|uniref:Uncharacterized protein n=1 Tax=Tanacetum coccineum TaxID=301880 RepID=A0ABQ4Y9T0_9ASTR